MILRKINFKIRKQTFLLLEVLIAFALVVLCILPLIYPHVAILRSEKAFISTVELDHLVSLLYADCLVKLYKKEIALTDILNEKESMIDESWLQDVGYEKRLPYKGSYKFVLVKQKPPKTAENPLKKTVYLFKLIFSFKQIKEEFIKASDEPIEYCYKVMIEGKHE